MRTNAVALAALIQAVAIVALPVLPEVNSDLSDTASPILHARQAALVNPVSLPWPLTGVNLDPATLVPDLASDLKSTLDGIQRNLNGLQQTLPKDLPEALALIQKLALIAAQVATSAVNTALYLPQGLYNGNPLIPLSGQLPGALSGTSNLINGITPANGLLPAILTGLPAGLGLSVPTLPPLALPSLGLPALPVASAGPIIPVAIPTTILRPLPALLPTTIVAAVPTLVPTRVVQAVPTNIPALLQPLLPKPA